MMPSIWLLSMLTFVNSVEGQVCSSQRFHRFDIHLDSSRRALCAIAPPPPLKTIAKTNHLGECLKACTEQDNCFAYTYHSDTTRCDLDCLPKNYSRVANCNTYLREDTFRCLNTGCQNGGICQNMCNDFKCTCAPTFSGKNCEMGRDCASFVGLSSGLRTVGVSGKPVAVFCDMSTPGGGWLVFQRRLNGSVNFERNWANYTNGFGDKSKEFWLGLDTLHTLTSARVYKLRIDLEDFNGNSRYAEYSSFTVGSPATNYTLHVGSYTGDAGDSLAGATLEPNVLAQDMQFSTYDVDHDLSADNCAVIMRRAWWYNACHAANLNGAYLGGPHTTNADGIEWFTWTGYRYSLKFTEMKIAAVN